MNLGKNLFIFGCMVVIAFSAGTVAWALSQISVPAAATFGLSTLAIQLVGYMFVWKAIISKAIKETLAELMTIEAENATSIQRLTNEFKGLRKTQRTQIAEQISPFTAEIEVLSNLIGTVAQSVADIQSETPIQSTTNPTSDASPQKQAIIKSSTENAALAKLKQAARQQAQAVANQVENSTAPSIQEEPADAQIEALVGSPSPSTDQIEKARVLIGKVKRAVEAERIDLNLQPIVSIPQRKPTHYEALARLKDAEQNTILPTEFLPITDRLELTQLIDETIIKRAVPILQKLSVNGNVPSMFCNISPVTLHSLEFFDLLKMQLDSANLDPKQIILEISTKNAADFTVIETANMDILRTSGFRFSIDQVTNIEQDFRKLRSTGFSFIKIASSILLNARDNAAGDIHPMDLSTLLTRNGLELIVDEIEAETELIDLLDFNTNLGQGNLFGKPKLVRSEIWKKPIDNTAARAAAALKARQQRPRNIASAQGAVRSPTSAAQVTPNTRKSASGIEALINAKRDATTARRG